MKEKKIFLQWAVMASLIVTGAALAFRLGYASYLEDDPTHITYVTLGVFALATAWCGRLCWRLARGDDPKAVEIDLKHGWFASSLCVSIGLIGTAVGYYLMLKHGDSEGDPKEVINMAFANTAIAIVNTVVGAVCGVLVEVQSHYLEYHVEKAQQRPAKRGKKAEAPKAEPKPQEAPDAEK